MWEINTNWLSNHLISYSVHFIHERTARSKQIKEYSEKSYRGLTKLKERENYTKQRESRWKEWNEYKTNKKIKKKLTASHDTYLTTKGDVVAAAAWTALNNATNFNRLSWENHLSFHVRGTEAGFSLVSADAVSSALSAVPEWQNSDVACFRAKVTHQLSLPSRTWTRTTLNFV